MVIETVFQTEGLPVCDRFEWWRDLALKSPVPAEHVFTGTGDFRARLRYWETGAARVSLLACSPLRSRRTPALVRWRSPENYRLVMNLDGTHQAYSYGRDQRSTKPDELVVYDTSRPHDARILAPQDTARMILVDLPRTTLSLPARKVDPLMGVPLTVADGTGALVSRFVTGLVEQAADCTPATAARLSGVLADLLAVLLSQYADAACLVAPGSRRQAMVTSVYTFIEAHLGEPGLAPATIAAAHHISLRHLHQLFDDQGITPAAWIRQRRLHHCRRDLADPLLAERPIGAIATRWGFRHAQDFSRVFRAAFGIAPRDYRQHATPTDPALPVNGRALDVRALPAALGKSLQ